MFHKTNSFQGLFNIEFQFFHAAVGTLCAVYDICNVHRAVDVLRHYNYMHMHDDVTSAHCLSTLYMYLYDKMYVFACSKSATEVSPKRQSQLTQQSSYDPELNPFESPELPRSPPDAAAAVNGITDDDDDVLTVHDDQTPLMDRCEKRSSSGRRRSSSKSPKRASGSASSASRDRHKTPPTKTVRSVDQSPFESPPAAPDT